MIGWLFEFILQLFLRRMRRQVGKRIERHALRAYLKGVQGARCLLLFAMAIFLFFQMMIFGFVALIAAVLMWAPWAIEIKALILMGIAGVSFVAPFCVVLILMSEKAWFLASGAAALFPEE